MVMAFEVVEIGSVKQGEEIPRISVKQGEIPRISVKQAPLHELIHISDHHSMHIHAHAHTCTYMRMCMYIHVPLMTPHRS